MVDIYLYEASGKDVTLRSPDSASNVGSVAQVAWSETDDVVQISVSVSAPILAVTTVLSWQEEDDALAVTATASLPAAKVVVGITWIEEADGMYIQSGSVVIPTSYLVQIQPPEFNLRIRNSEYSANIISFEYGVRLNLINR